MVDIARLAFAVSVGLACVVVIVSAFVLAGAVLALIRADHRNPVARIGLDWYDRRWHEPPTRHA